MDLRRAVLSVIGALSAGLALGATPANAHNDILGWRDCSFNQLTFRGHDIVIGYDVNYPFPPDTIQDSVLNSFTARISGSAAQWDYHIVNSTSATGPGGMAYAGPDYYDVRLQYRDTVDNALGSTTRTYWSWSPTGCDIHGDSNAEIQLGTILMDRRSDWFTQDDSRRSLWEACPTAGGPTYTCSKSRDVQSTMVHEVGHAIGLHHPEDIDLHIGSGTAAATAGICGDKTRYATMCAVGQPYSSAKRTLAQWDVDTLSRHYTENL